MTKDTKKETGKSGTAATPAPGGAAPQGSQAAPPPAAAAPKRTRSALSAEKTMAIVIAKLVTIFKRAEIVAITSADEKAQIDAADKIAADLNAQTIDPLKKRIAEIQTEFQAISTKMAEPGANVADLADKAKKLSQELSTKQKQLETFTSILQA